MPPKGLTCKKIVQSHSDQVENINFTTTGLVLSLSMNVKLWSVFEAISSSSGSLISSGLRIPSTMLDDVLHENFVSSAFNLSK